MKDWIEEQRGTIMLMAKEGLLSIQLCGPLSRHQEEDLDGYINKLKDSAAIIDENAEEQLERYGENDYLNALSAEVVSYADEQLIKDFLTKAVGVHSINFAELKAAETEVTFIGEHLKSITDKISEIIDGFSDGEKFILCGPLEISIIQSITHGEFEIVKEDEQWKGKSFSHLVGYLNGVRLYAHISQIPDNDTIFVGNYNPNTVETTIHKITLSNLELA